MTGLKPSRSMKSSARPAGVGVGLGRGGGEAVLEIDAGRQLGQAVDQRHGCRGGGAARRLADRGRRAPSASSSTAPVATRAPSEQRLGPGRDQQRRAWSSPWRAASVSSRATVARRRSEALAPDLAARLELLRRCRPAPSPAPGSPRPAPTSRARRWRGTGPAWRTASGHRRRRASAAARPAKAGRVLRVATRAVAPREPGQGAVPRAAGDAAECRSPPALARLRGSGPATTGRSRRSAGRRAPGAGCLRRVRARAMAKTLGAEPEAGAALIANPAMKGNSRWLSMKFCEGRCRAGSVSEFPPWERRRPVISVPAAIP